MFYENCLLENWPRWSRVVLVFGSLNKLSKARKRYKPDESYSFVSNENGKHKATQWKEQTTKNGQIYWQSIVEVVELFAEAGLSKLDLAIVQMTRNDLAIAMIIAEKFCYSERIMVDFDV